ncbi:MAG TPA: hypothetical protein QF487_02155 [Acidimicrobiales bacterium]|jgi:hypothetical protein|nr:hypothetical protein [Acidimicrobiales bacterium]|tara:strand:- start:417 stop:557 length:141 start_codon:yes stop_codon:yes gene_type:complete
MMRTIKGALESVLAAAAVAGAFRILGIDRIKRQVGGWRQAKGPDLR